MGWSLNFGVNPETRFINSRAQRNNWRNAASAVSGPAYVRNDSPFFQQPFRYIAAITVALTPDSQLTRTAVGFRGETQAERNIFELGCHGRRKWERLSPTRISSFLVNHGQMSNHTPMVGP
jgi:hypothetical protein